MYLSFPNCFTEEQEQEGEEGEEDKIHQQKGMRLERKLVGWLDVVHKRMAACCCF